MEGEEVRNKQVVLKNYVTGFPKESDMEINITKIRLKLPEDSNGVLVKNLYVACDPYIRNRIKPAHIKPYQLGSILDSRTSREM